MNNYDSILNCCVDSSEGFRDWMKKPFIIGERVFSTNGHILVSVPKEKCLSDYSDLETYDPKKIIEMFPKPEMVPSALLTNQELKSIVDSCPKINEKIKVGADEECDACNGDGYVDYEFHYSGNKKVSNNWGRTYTEELECPICDGGGLMEEVEERETENLIPKENAILKIKQSYFFMWNFRKLYEISTLNDGCDMILVSQIGNLTPNLFQCGVIDIVIMPISSSEDEDPFYKLD